MKKSTMRVLSLVMALMMIVGTLATVPFSAYAEPGSDNDVTAVAEHVHTETEEGYVKTVPATCALYGYDVYKCPDCGEEFATNITEKTGHKYVEYGEVDADCKTGTPGYTAGEKCEYCGKIKTGCEEIEAEHEIAYRLVDGLYNFDEDGEYFTTADCVEGVTYQKYCNKCGAILQDRVNIIVEGEEEHDLTIRVDEVVPPTCLEDGYIIVYCTDPANYIIFDDCQYEGPVKVKIKAPGKHDWKEVNDPIDGYYWQCSRCGETYVPVDDDTKPSCHQWQSEGLAFYKDTDDTTMFSSKNFTGTASEFLTEYTKYSDYSNLYEIFTCTVCSEVRAVLRVDKVDHQYGEYTFKYVGAVQTKNGTTTFTEDHPFTKTLTGNVTYTYECGKAITTTKTCGICKTRLGQSYKPTVSKSATVQKHKYEEHWICKNADCANNGSTIELTIAGIDGQSKFVAKLPEGFYNCKDCMHDHAEEICIMPAGDLKVFYNYTKFVKGDNKLPEADPTMEKVYELKFEVVPNDENTENITYNVDDLRVCCGEYTLEAHNHIFGGYQIVDEGDCQHNMKKRAVCKRERCGKLYGDILDTGIKGKHVMPDDWQYLPAATCMQEGERFRACMVQGCDYSERETLAKDPTNHEDPRMVKEEKSTCTENGKQYWKCFACEAEWTVTLELAPHDYDTRAAVEANCFDSGLKPYAVCKNCHQPKEVDGVVYDGAYIPAFNHNLVNIARQGLDKVESKDITVNKNSANFRYVDFALGHRAFKVVEDAETVTYSINYVAATCAKDGYIIGEYCTLCAERFGNADLSFEFDNNEVNYTGYILPKTNAHTIVRVKSADELPEDWYSVCGGEVYYEFDFDYCVVCGKYEDDDITVDQFREVKFDKLTARDHKPAYEEKENEDDEDVIVEVTLVYVNGEYIELTEENEYTNGMPTYPDCVYPRYTAKVCRFCEDYYDIEETEAAKGHYLINVDGSLTVIMGGCNAYDPQYVGLTCFACGKKVPYYETVEIEEGEYAGLSDEYYYDRKNGNELTNLEGYITVDHVWVEDLDCEKADIMECAICGIKVLNEEKEVRGYHEYLLRDDEEKDYDKFDLEKYDFYDYAYKYVIVSTPSKLGYGVLECIHCGKELKVDAPALSATFTAAYDDPTDVVNNVAIKNVLVGDTVTVTIKVTAGEFKFSELNFDIRLLPNYFELLDAEVLYDFGAADKVDHNISYKQGTDDDADITFTCVGANRDATIKNAKNADFLRLTFKVGEFTEKSEVTNYKDDPESTAGIINTITAKTVDAEAASTIQENTSFGEINIYNPNYSSTDSVLTAIYGDRNAAQYDFNKDGIVDLVDYDMLASYASSAKTVWDFYTLIGYDIEGMLDSLDYTNVSYGYGRTFENGVETTVPGTEGDIIVAKEKIRTTLKSTAYASVIGTQTIVDLAKSVIVKA